MGAAIRNNNPLNVKGSPTNMWEGSYEIDAAGHARFIARSWGIRAAVRSIVRKYANGKRNLMEIIADWAPASDTQGSIPGRAQNQPGRYAAYVAEEMGIAIYDDLMLARGGQLSIDALPRLLRMMSAMARYEDRSQPPILLAEVLQGLADYADTYHSEQTI